MIIQILKKLKYTPEQAMKTQTETDRQRERERERERESRGIDLPLL